MDFYRRMRMVCLRIPKGKVATYGQIALLCGKPANSRQVGYGLRKGLAGEDVPAHRVVNARGILSGAAAFSEAGLQERLLAAENPGAYLTRICVNLYRDWARRKRLLSFISVEQEQPASLQRQLSTDLH